MLDTEGWHMFATLGVSLGRMEGLPVVTHTQVLRQAPGAELGLSEVCAEAQGALSDRPRPSTWKRGPSPGNVVGPEGTSTRKGRPQGCSLL